LVDQGGVLGVDGRSYRPRRLPLGVHLHHATRDAEANLSGGCHRVEHDAPVGLDLPDIAVAVTAMAGILAAAAEARHVAHELAVRDLKLVQPLDVRPGLGHEAWPNDLCQVTVRLRGGFVLRKSASEVVSRRGIVLPARATNAPHDEEQGAGNQVPACEHNRDNASAR
jgi:hypothetical protein